MHRRANNDLVRKIKITDFSAQLDFSSNDYLGLSRDRDLAHFITESYKSYISHQPSSVPVMGSTGSRLLTGNSDLYVDTEKYIASFHSQKECILSNSGWDLNFGLLSSISSEDTVVVYDEYIHNSLVMGIRAGRSKSIHSFQHNNLTDLTNLLYKNKRKEIVIVIESIYSMDGDMAPLKDIFELALETGAMVLVDEAHSVGVYGPRGDGLVSALQLQQHPNLLGVVYTFGKAVGQHGAALVTPHEILLTYLANYSKPLIYSTSLPIHSIISIREAYRAIASAHVARTHLFSLVELFKTLSRASSIPLLAASESPIQAVIVPTNAAVIAVAQQLQLRGFSCFPIRAPTVPAGTERIRVILHSHNTVEDVSRLVESLVEVLKQNNVI